MKLTAPARTRIVAEVEAIYGLEDMDEADCSSIFQQLEIAALEIWPLMSDDGKSSARVTIYSIAGNRDACFVEAGFSDFVIVER